MKNGLFRPVQDALDILIIPITGSDNIGGGFNQVAENLLFADDFCVMNDCGGGGNISFEEIQVIYAADGIVFAFFAEFFGNGEDVDGFIGLEQLADGKEGFLVAGFIKILLFQNLERFSNGFNGFQAGSQNALLRFQIIGGKFA